MTNRVAVFIDAQNVYQGARGRFYSPRAHGRAGQIAPVALASLLCERANPLQSAPQERVLTQVRVYSGRPDATRDPKTYGAHRRQAAAWERSGAVVINRPLRYPPGWPAQRAEEKGIDVQLAIDFAAGAIDDEYDTGIICSTDTDLLPALEFVATRFGRERAETAAWLAGGKGSELRLRRPSTWCHRLEFTDYESVRDPNDYASP
ncbi:MAG: NYN domain-containing protein [Dehalococcoidia bacterium]|nr:NYN domain-containing protein [Dehalococcoidia bacterium]MYA54288.1 NYN domain-containing protein [Dehalococcoidia bacterium]